MDERELVERLGGLEVGDRVRVTPSGGEPFEGQANPIDYVPGDSLRVEVRPESGSGDRYEISSKREDDGWSDLQTRHADMAAEATEWEDLGTVERVETEDEWDRETSEE